MNKITLEKLSTPPSPRRRLGRRPLQALSLVSAGTLLAALACGGSENGDGDGNSGGMFGGNSSGGNSSGGSTNTSGGTANFGGGAGSSFIDSGLDDGGLDEDSACEAQSAEATLVKKPVDIIFLIDNSGSMAQEIQAVQNNIAVNFANIIEASEIDYRVIMVARHGKLGDESVCIEAPLSGIPAGGCATPPSQPVNGSRFFHYSVEIGSHNSLCKIFDTFTAPDEHNLAPEGWSKWLRDDSFKMFVEITDDGVHCDTADSAHRFRDQDNINQASTIADAFDQAVRALSPTHFGAIEGERNYRFYSIVGLAANSPVSAPWQPSDPLQSGQCSPGSVGNGSGYQGLSLLTEGLRYPSCHHESFDSIFLAMAEGVIEGSKVACQFGIPTPTDGSEIDLDTVVTKYTPGGGGASQLFDQVANAAACTPNAFYIENSTVFLCPDACTLVQQDDAANIDILFGCKGKIPR